MPFAQPQMKQVSTPMIFYGNTNYYLPRESLAVITATLLKESNNIFLSNERESKYKYNWTFSIGV